MAQSTPNQQRAPALKLAANVWIAGIVSLFTDVSSEMMVPILPLFLDSLGAPKAAIGIIEGLAEATASVVKSFSGWLSDRIGLRKPLMLAGYGLSNIIKPLFGLVTAWPGALVLRVADRFGKGVRGAPRDALIADYSSPQQRGRAFGVHRAMDTIGGALGPALVLLLLHLRSSYHTIFFTTAIPGLLGVLAVLALKEKRRVVGNATARAATGTAAAGSPGDTPVMRGFTLSTRHLAPELRWYILVACVFALGNSADAFLILKAKALGLSDFLTTLAYVCFNLTYAALGYPLGSLSDRVGRRPVLIGGLAAFAVIYAGFGMATHAWATWPLFVAYGAYMAATEGIQKAYITDLARTEERGAAVGAFNAYTGLAALPASIAAGLLWDRLGPASPFWLGAAMALIAALLLLLRPYRRSAQQAA